MRPLPNVRDARPPRCMEGTRNARRPRRSDIRSNASIRESSNSPGRAARAQSLRSVREVRTVRKRRHRPARLREAPRRPLLRRARTRGGCFVDSSCSLITTIGRPLRTTTIRGAFRIDESCSSPLRCEANPTAPRHDRRTLPAPRASVVASAPSAAEESPTARRGRARRPGHLAAARDARRRFAVKARLLRSVPARIEAACTRCENRGAPADRAVRGPPQSLALRASAHRVPVRLLLSRRRPRPKRSAPVSWFHARYEEKRTRRR